MLLGDHRQRMPHFPLPRVHIRKRQIVLVRYVFDWGSQEKHAAHRQLNFAASCTGQNVVSKRTAILKRFGNDAVNRNHGDHHHDPQSHRQNGQERANSAVPNALPCNFEDVHSSPP